MRPKAGAPAVRAEIEEVTLTSKFPVWAVVFAVVLVLAALLKGGAIDQDQVQAVAANLAAGMVYLLLTAMTWAAAPIILLAALMLLHDRTKAIELAIAGFICAVVAGLWHFGAWDWLTSHGGAIAQPLLRR